MNIEETARDAAIASAGGKTALTSGGLLAGLGVLSSEWVFGIIGACIGLAGLAIQFYFQMRARSDRLRQVEEQAKLDKEEAKRSQEIHAIKMQLYIKQLNTGQPGQGGADGLLASPPHARPKQTPGLPTTDFGGLADE